MAGGYHRELIDDCSAAPLIQACKELGKKFVYCFDDVLRLEIMCRYVIHDLMDILWEGAEKCDDSSEATNFFGKIYRLISPNYRSVFMNTKTTISPGGATERYRRLQLVMDQIAGMTDTFACTLHKRLRNG